MLNYVLKDYILIELYYILNLQEQNMNILQKKKDVLSLMKYKKIKGISIGGKKFYDVSKKVME